MAEFLHTIYDLYAYGDPEDLLPLEDEEKTSYVTVEAAKSALAQGKKLARTIIIDDGEMILEHILEDTEFQLLSTRQAVRAELLIRAQALAPFQSVLVAGQPVMCKGFEIKVFGGYGKSQAGRAWVIIETHLHKPPPSNILEALVDSDMITEAEAKAWRDVPSAGCLEDHPRSM